MDNFDYEILKVSCINKIKEAKIGRRKMRWKEKLYSKFEKHLIFKDI